MQWNICLRHRTSGTLHVQSPVALRLQWLADRARGSVMFALKPPPPHAIDLDNDPDNQSPNTTAENPALHFFTITTNLRLQPVELLARQTLRLNALPTKQSLLNCLELIPRSHIKTGPEGSQYVVGGCNPRSRYEKVTHSRTLPFFNMLVCRYLRHLAPQHRFTTYVVRFGAIERPHRDVRNAPLPTLLVALKTPEPNKDGLWVQDVLHGCVIKDHHGSALKGTVLSIEDPLLFQPRSFLHAGHVHDLTKKNERVVLVAFSTLHASVLHWEAQEKLQALGFPLPTQAELFRAVHGSIPGDPPRLKQLSMHDFLQSKGPDMDDHDVVEVWDDPDDADEVEVVD